MTPEQNPRAPKADPNKVRRQKVAIRRLERRVRELEAGALCFHAAKGERCTRYLEGAEGELDEVLKWLRSLPHDAHLKSWVISQLREGAHLKRRSEGEGRSTSATRVEAADPLTAEERASMPDAARSRCCAVRRGTAGGVVCDRPLFHLGEHSDGGDWNWPAEPRRPSEATPTAEDRELAAGLVEERTNDASGMLGLVEDIALAIAAARAEGRAARSDYPLLREQAIAWLHRFADEIHSEHAYQELASILDAPPRPASPKRSDGT